jgi:hypothetical protein
MRTNVIDSNDIMESINETEQMDVEKLGITEEEDQRQSTR